ncbi:hypothetical protein DBR47_20365 [Paucibacter sp. KBW04]|uniref:DUF2306 domain-containing protein n=1 Tax=Paucibacter sp. KBW04 TaxID=2153361 RepID=UPI000F56FFB8|nr:DUF2306 domain-containing protein [Paucibacter sp. KBW04]RQO55608.1 hypothetical protein DBR47_20365 [Paucibacter sp. KBW04]
MNHGLKKSDFGVPIALLVLAAFPVLVGCLRLAQLASGAEVTPANARFMASPLPIVLHIVASSVFAVLGAFQFSPWLRSRAPRLHRIAGRVAVVGGGISAASGLWMTLFYPRVELPPASFDGPWLFTLRLLVGFVMLLALARGLWAIRQRDLQNHRAWVMRAYALGMGAGTQVFTHIPWFLFPSLQGEWARTICMGAGWAINLAIAECFIRQARRNPASPRPARAHTGLATTRY